MPAAKTTTTTTTTITLRQNLALVNAIRRVILQSIPNYGFDPDNIDIKTNTTRINNDELRQRLQNFPVFGLDHGAGTFQSFLSGHRDLVIQNNPEGRGQGPEPPALTMACSVTHDKPGVDEMALTTADCRFSVDGKEVSHPYRAAPLLICYLHPGERLSFVATSSMATPRVSPCYAVANAYFKEVKTDEEYEMTIEPMAEILPTEILRRAAVILLDKVGCFVEAATKENGGQTEGTLIVSRDKYTIAGLITYYMQSHKDNEYGACRCPHMLDDVSEIFFRLAPHANLMGVLADAAASIRDDIKSVIKGFGGLEGK